MAPSPLVSGRAAQAPSYSCGGADPAEAFIASRKHSAGDIKKYYLGAIPLRYGFDVQGRGFGWRHIRDKHGWSPKIDHCIRDVLGTGSCKPLNGAPTRINCKQTYTVGYDPFGHPYHCRFLVSYEQNAVPSDYTGGILGIITAYWELPCGPPVIIF